jgi:hypothetical protein
MELVRRLYPIRIGIRAKEFVSGAKLQGNVKNDAFSGFAVMIWPDKSTYSGDWAENLRDGLGVFR